MSNRLGIQNVLQASFWKIVLFLTLMSWMVPGLGMVSDYSTLYSNFTSTFQTKQYQLDDLLITETLQGTERFWQSKITIIIIQISSSWILYSVSKCINVEF